WPRRSLTANSIRSEDDRKRSEGGHSPRKLMTNALPIWVEEARALPVAFAQVREDPLLDVWIVGQLGDQASIAMIASGGCTAAFLAATRNVARLHLVDANPAQHALTQLKLRLLAAPPAF